MNRYYFDNHVLTEKDDCTLVHDLNRVAREYGLNNEALECFGVSMYDNGLSLDREWSIVDYGSRETEVLCYNGKVYGRNDPLFDEIDSYITGGAEGLAYTLVDYMIDTFSGEEPDKKEFEREAGYLTNKLGIDEIITPEEDEEVIKEMVRIYYDL